MTDKRDIPRKLKGTTSFFSGCCPNCEEYILYIKAEYTDIKRCPYCGQLIMWEE